MLILENTLESTGNSSKIMKIMKMIKFIKVIRLLRIMKLKAMLNKLIVYFDISHLAQVLLGFFRLSLIVLFLVFAFKCIIIRLT